jgi:predicted RNA methylase
VRALTRLRRSVLGAAFERRLNVQTVAIIVLDELGLADPERNEYQPTPWRDLKKVLPRGEVSADDVFLDLGAGMGRVVLLAARYPFKRVIGVELSDELADVARRNVEQARPKLRCRDIEIVTADALTYVIPDDVTVLYLYNPFTGETFQRVLDNVVASLERAPRRLRVVYRRPTEHDRVMATGRARQVREHVPRTGKGQTMATSITRVYELRPAA